MSRQKQSHSDEPENNSCQKIEITDSKKMPYNHDYSEDVERRSDTMKHPINRVHMSTFDCLNKTKRHCWLINLIVMIISDWLTLADILCFILDEAIFLIYFQMMVQNILVAKNHAKAQDKLPRQDQLDQDTPKIVTSYLGLRGL